MTTYSPTFKNKTIDSLAGRAANSSILTYVNCYAGAAAIDPATAPAGSFVNTVTTNAPSVSGVMTAPAAGISGLSVARVGSANASNAITAAFARIYDATPTAMIDTPITNSGGGGGVIAAVLASVTSAPFQIDNFTLKVPLVNGAVMYNTALANALNSMWTQAAANIAALSSATISIYTGSAPATADLPATGTLLVTFSTAAAGASWNAAAAGSAALAASITSAAAVAGGTAGYARITKGAYTMQLSVGTSGTNLIINNTTIVAASTYSLTDATITL